MAWTSIGTGGTAANTANNQASIALTVATNNVGVGEVGILSVSQDNPGNADSFTTSGAANPVVSTVTDSAGNVWNCAGEQVKAGNAQTGISCSLWWTKATADLPVGGTITATFVSTSSASFDESAASLWVFGASGGQVSVLASTGVVADASTVLGVIDQTVSTGDNLRFRAVATESSATTALTTSSGWSAITFERSAAIVTATAIRGEFLITASSTAASSATLDVSGDHASVYAVLQEAAASFGDGDGAAVIEFIAASSGDGQTSLDGAAVVEFVAAGEGASQADAFGSANVDFSADAVGQEIAEAGAGSAVIDFVASAGGDSFFSADGAAVVDFAASAGGESTFAADGSAVVDIAAAGVGDFDIDTVNFDGVGEAAIDFGAAAVGVFRRPTSTLVHTSITSRRSFTEAV